MKQDDIIKTQEAIDEASQYHADLYSRGKELYKRYSEMDENDQNMLDEFFVNEFGSDGFSRSFDEEAFKLYTNESQKSRKRNQPDVPKATGTARSLQLSDAIDKFIADNQDSAKAWGRSQLNKYKQNLAFFKDQMNNCYVAELTIDNIRRQYVNKLHLLPTHIQQNKLFYNKKGELLSIDKIIQLTKKHGLKTQSVRTYRGKADKVCRFLTALADEGYVDRQVLNAFNILKRVKKTKKKRPAFTDEDLKRIFNRDEFYKGLWFRKYIFRHWGLLLALYTGARLNEICQLDTKDVIRDKNTSIYYINITPDDETKGTKTLAGQRKVPVHKTLIELGFINYVKHQKSKGEIKLFSELTLGRDGKWGRKLKDWFNHKYLEQVGIDKYVSELHTTRSFHCFRKTVINFGKQNGLNRSVMEEIVGHEKAVKETVHDDYTDPYNLKNRKKEIDKIKFDIDIDKIKRWR